MKRFLRRAGVPKKFGLAEKFFHQKLVDIKMNVRDIFSTKYLVERIMGQITEKFQHLSVEDVRKKILA